MAGSASTSRRVFKALRIFGSVQAVGILCSVVRAKCIALWLGPAGVGIFGLYNSALEVLNQLVQLNLRQSGVREISCASGARSSFLSAVVRRLGCLLGVVGALLTLLLSTFLSRLTFGDDTHTLPFMLLSVVVFCNALIAGEQAVLQANSLFRRLARASLWGSVVATAIAVCLIRFWGFDAIVPSIITFGVVTAIAYRVGRSSVPRVSMTRREFTSASLPLLKLGVYMTAAVFTTMLAQYAFLAWLRSEGGEDAAGIYQSGYTIVTQYVGLVFTALAVEFFPRVSAVISSRMRTSLFVRHELSMLLWGLLGAIVLFVSLVPFIIRLLYDSTFLPVSDYVTIASVGTVFKAFSFVLAIVIIARGDGRIYLLTETVSSVLYFLLSIVGYRCGALQGLGVAYIVWYALYALSVFLVYRFRYRLTGLRRPSVLALGVIIAVAAQVALCLEDCYPAATVVSCLVVPFAGFMFYRLFLNRRTLKE